MWRQGDVLIAEVDAIPRNARLRDHCVLAEGELTGHSHRVDRAGVAELYESRGQLFLRVVGDEAEVVHQEHGTIALPRGDYRVWRQREYTPEVPLPVRD